MYKMQGCLKNHFNGRPKSRNEYGKGIYIYIAYNNVVYNNV
jgi:hypothetical protein